MTPERVERVEKATTKKAFRVLPPDLPESSRPPSPPRHYSVPVIGYIVERMLGLPARGQPMIDKYGKLYQSDYFLIDQLFVCDYAAIVDIMRDTDNFVNAEAFAGLDAVFKNAMLSLDGAAHTAARAVFAPAFSSVLFPHYFSFISDRAKSTWARVAEDTARGKRVLLDPIFREHYLSVTIETTTGISMDTEEAARIRSLFNRLQWGFFLYSMGPLAKSSLDARDELMKILCRVVRDNLKARRESIEKLRSYGDDLVKFGVKDIKKGEVDVLLVAIATSNLSTAPDAVLDEEVVENLADSVMLLWLAGYMTSAATSMSASLELGFNPSIVARLKTEQNDLVAAAGGSRAVTYEQTQEMPLLDSYLTEILRLHPPAPGMNRIATSDVEVLGNFVPKGTNLFCSFEAAQRDPGVYPQPDELIPYRFMRKPKPPPVLAFGPPGSPHYCIGAAFAKTMMKTTFATLLREYELVLDPNQSTEYRYIPETAPKSGVVVKELRKRPE